MKIAVFSDIHDNLVRWDEAAAIIKDEKIDTGICCGDLLSLETLQVVARSFKKLYLATGNGDYVIKRAKAFLPKNVEHHGNVGLVELGGKKIAFCHYDWLGKKLFESRNYDIIFYGHSHTPWEKREDGRIMLNPGEIAGEFGQASFAVFDFNDLAAELKLLT